MRISDWSSDVCSSDLIVRFFDSFSTAQYQYIPALSSHRGNKLALTLNTPPSFYNPKSVMVVALPAVEKPRLPPLHAVNPTDIYCASRADRSEEHTSELQSLMRTSYAVFLLQKT